MSKVLEALPVEAKAVIEDVLTRRDPGLLRALHLAESPSRDQSLALVDTLMTALSAHFGPGHIPDAQGVAIDNAIGAYLLAWPFNQ